MCWFSCHSYLQVVSLCVVLWFSISSSSSLHRRWRMESCNASKLRTALATAVNQLMHTLPQTLRAHFHCFLQRRQGTIRCYCRSGDVINGGENDFHIEHMHIRTFIPAWKHWKLTVSALLAPTLLFSMLIFGCGYCCLAAVALRNHYRNWSFRCWLLVSSKSYSSIFPSACFAFHLIFDNA